MNGTMKYTRRVNLGNYEHKEFTAEISYAVNDDDDYLVSKDAIDRAADLAVEIAETRLGLREPTIPVMAPAKVPHTPKSDELQVKMLDRLGMAFSTAPAPVEYIHNAPITAAEVAKASAPVAEPVEEPIDVEPQPQSVEIPDNDGVILESTPAIEPETFDATAPVEEISTDDLKSAIEAWVYAGTEPKTRHPRVAAAQKLIRKYATQLSSIPQEQRPTFRDEFAKLQANVA